MAAKDRKDRQDSFPFIPIRRGIRVPRRRTMEGGDSIPAEQEGPTREKRIPQSFASRPRSCWRTEDTESRERRARGQRTENRASFGSSLAFKAIRFHHRGEEHTEVRSQSFRSQRGARTLLLYSMMLHCVAFICKALQHKGSAMIARCAQLHPVGLNCTFSGRDCIKWLYKTGDLIRQGSRAFSAIRPVPRQQCLAA